ncbi:SNF2 family helicase/ATPase and F-box protein [Achlya hypogyna]|uniref:SNF2 family helicase/ATPase and F-box protein n=1 Tax=Achlya hypogyna TaxID=1202772 RepID=A0A1V9YBT5_ACHHY|nr:SNF2 family helicase/ATPase and F-box protein [Achlya hypogyna]
MNHLDSPLSDRSSVASYGPDADEEVAVRSKATRQRATRSKRGPHALRGAYIDRKRRKIQAVAPDSPVPDVNADESSAEEVAVLMQAKQRVLDALESLAAAAAPLPAVEAAPPLVLSRRLSHSAVVAETTSGVRHWDFLLQEMQWMATDFAQERKWRVRKAKTLSVSVVSHHAKKATAAARTSQHEEAHRKRVAAKLGRDVKKFWQQIDKVASYEFQAAEEARRKAEMESQLQFLVAQTEKYAAALATTFALPMTDDSDGDFEMNGDSDVDDETTIAQEEAAQSAEDTTLELRLLDEEASMSIEELRAKYAGDGSDAESDANADSGNCGEDIDGGEEIAASGPINDASPLSGEIIESASDGDFEMDGDSEVDDETTIAQEEAAQSAEDTALELQLLDEEAEMSIDELRAKYAAMADNAASDVDADGGSDEGTPTGTAQTTVGDAADSTSDGDFEINGDSDVDDETTIAQEEAAQSAEDTAHEIAQLEVEANMSVEELRALYACGSRVDDDPMDADADATSGTEKPCIDAPIDSASDGDFEMDSDGEVDDETTIAEEEAAQSAEDRALELELLDEEAEMSLEALQAKYAALANGDSDHDYSEVIDSDTDACEVASEANNTDHNDCEGATDPKDVADANDATAVASPVSAPVAESDLWAAVGVVRPYLLHPSLHLRAYQTAGVAWLLSLAHNRMSGILADEMGLGKTIQTISLLAALATEGIWGPHLIVVPTSCLLNWEMELKRWCPAFKIMTYYGSAKRRKDLRNGWSKANAFQVCITSYQLVVADAPCFKRKRWYYLILDEAHNIKNWKSQRWQTLLTFNTQRRLLLTGTPLQNNVLELWALLHFLMPHLFRSRAQFTHWFNTPLDAMVEGEADVNNSLVGRLHRIIRPFVLRRLKKDVAKQMPAKYEHVLLCPLSKRQAFLYEDFMARSSTRKAMAGGNFVGMMNVLMQLRKVCNHPDLFEPRPIASPWDLPPLTLAFPLSAAAVARQPPPRVLWRSAAAATTTVVGTPRLFVDDVALPMPPTVPPTASSLVHAFVATHHALTVAAVQAARVALADENARRCAAYVPLLTDEWLAAWSVRPLISPAMDVHGRPDAASDALCAMVRSGDARFDAVAPLLPHVLCVVPRARAAAVEVAVAGPLSAGRVREASQWAATAAAVEQHLSPLTTALHPIAQRRRLHFPDKRLVQFDCGKLQRLDQLLRDRKRGGHRCLIFSQMSSMLNILEVFLNIHGHTYFRLDGSTPVEKRQRLMDRFNADDKVFCFILSTRSGGLGINLTGADTVIFYDSDWNPAMDAQAQDRAHRIGQTRDVHIYRLVSEHTVEENILRKATQKRHLDALVMADGQFTTEYFSKASLRDLVAPGADASMTIDDDDTPDASAIEAAMGQLEDSEDAAELQAAQAALATEKELDDGGFEDEPPVAPAESEPLERGLQSQLRPIDRMALRFRQTVDPVLVVPSAAPLDARLAQEELELERIEADKVVDEETAIADGDLIVAGAPASATADAYLMLETTPTLTAQRRVYQKARRQVHRARRLRAISGDAWTLRTCTKSALPYYFNEDTREAQWDQPPILVKNEVDRTARAGGFAALPPDVLLRVAAYCAPRDRLLALARVCKPWASCAVHSQFFVRVHADDDCAAVIAQLQPGDTVVFGSGNHLIAKSLVVRAPVRFTGPLNGGTCTVQLAPGTELEWRATGGEMRGLHLCADGPTPTPLLRVPPLGHVTLLQCHLSGGDACVAVHGGVAVVLDSTLVRSRRSGVVVAGGAAVVASSDVADHGQCGATVLHGRGIFRKSTFARNGRYGVRLLTGTQLATVDGNRFVANGCGALDVEHSSRRIVVRQSHVVPATPGHAKPHMHGVLKVHDVLLQDVCMDKLVKEPRPKKPKTTTVATDANCPAPIADTNESLPVAHTNGPLPVAHANDPASAPDGAAQL